MRHALSGAWGVFWLFTIPVGGGIPAGVLLAKARGLSWLVMELLYFLSDLVLACTFEPVMLLIVAGAKRSARLKTLAQAMRAAMHKTTASYGTAAGPLALVLIAFGVDPMTGRAAAKAAGHGFVTGWALAIAGDMMYFTVIMASTLWLNKWLDATKTMALILVAMLVVPGLIRRFRERVKKPS